MAKEYLGEFNSSSKTENLLNSGWVVGEEGLLNIQNLLSVTIVICPQSLKNNEVFQVLNLLNCQSLIENQEERTTWPRPPRQNGNSVNLSFYFNHRHVHTSK